MYSKNNSVLALIIVLILLLSACTSKNEAPDPGQVLTQAAELASQGSTLTAIAKPPSSTPLPPPATLAPVPSATSEIIPTNALIIVTEDNPQPIFTEAVVIPSPTQNLYSDCYKALYASEGGPADYSHYRGTTSFTKTWRIFNSGTCAWTSDVYLVHVATTIFENNVEGPYSTETFGQGTEIVVISDPIQPGEYLNIEIEFTAPAAGNDTYKVYYKLYGPGGIFDISGTAVWFIIKVTPP